ncbi:MAG: deoxyribose-phosphate aldolase [Duncaniella sp.]|nr:deoxyribose-phosphate aldolase [Duncaniella sp.]
MDKYQQMFADSKVATDDAAISAAVKEILDKHLEENRKPEVLKRILNSIDLTTLKSTDSQRSVADFVEKVNAFDNDYPDLPNVAAICVYPNFVPIVRTVLDVSAVDIAAVAGSFPSAQTFIEVKIAEIALAVESGADEIDIVLPMGDFFDHDYEEVSDQISEMKHACRNALLKVILETGALKSAENIRNASILALNAGADFLKTSTGKEYEGASLEAAYVMCQCIKEYYEKSGRMVGFKVSGGVSTTEQALTYYTLVREILGEEWVATNETFRIGASRLANNVVDAITGSDIRPF